MYDFLAGPGVWISAIVFFTGLFVRAAFLYGLSRGKDKVLYDHFDWGWSLRSIFAWLVPLGSVSLRKQPIFSIVFFVFHVCLLAAPIFLAAHNILFEEAFGWSLPSLPDGVADVLTLLVILSAVFLFLRRLIRPEVRILATPADFIVLLLTMLPFLTGFLAYHQIGEYQTMLVLHVLSGEIMLIVIPFSKLGHVMLFFFTRAFIGSDMGARREIEGRLGARTW